MIKNTCIVWHGHHVCDSPLEFLDESFKARLNTIRTIKAKTETKAQIKLRKKLFKKVKGKLPKILHEARAKLREARAKWREANAELHEALAELHEADAKVREADAKWREANTKVHEADANWCEAVKECMPQILKLHAKECGCKWAPKNTNIFKYMKVA